jgi:dTDP-4-amino-4,6-dideoxygalactose transaminase
MIVPLLDLKAQYETIRGEIRSAVDQVFESQKFILGPAVSGLEANIANYCGVPSAIAVASGTDAILISLKALGIGPGDSVITTPYTFFATAGAVWNLGARPLFVDITSDTYLLDPALLAEFLARECEQASSGQPVIHKPSGTVVKAILPVHLYGQCADMDEIRSLADGLSLPVVEDACQAIGAKYKGRRAGALGSLGCLSFFPSKNLGGAGDGGMVVSVDERLGRQVRLLRTHGMEPKYFHKIVGYNSRLDELQAAILDVKLKHLDQWTQGRQRNAAAYEKDFTAANLLSVISVPATGPDRDHIFHQYVIRCPRRDELQQHLKEHGIGTEVYYPLPLHEQECFGSLGYKADAFPVSSRAARETLALPVYPELRDEQRLHVVCSIAEFYS